MTAATEFKEDFIQPTMVPVRVRDGGRMLARVIQRILGVGLALSAFGLWVLPGSNWETDVALLKLAFSAMTLIAGLSFILCSVKPRRPQIEIDTVRRELRVVRPAVSGANVLLERCRFADLGRVERDRNHVRFWDEAGRLLAEVTLSDRRTLNSLLAGLRDAGKLA